MLPIRLPCLKLAYFKCLPMHQGDIPGPLAQPVRQEGQTPPCNNLFWQLLSATLISFFFSFYPLAILPSASPFSRLNSRAPRWLLKMILRRLSWGKGRIQCSGSKQQ